MRLGLIADTHGHLFEDAADALRRAQVQLVLHAGDVGCERVLDQLSDVAPVVAVAGNGDEDLYHRLTWELRLNLGGRRVFLCHWYDNYGRIHPGYEHVVRDWRPQALIYGHTHQATVQRRDETLFLNPGYAGPPEPSRTRSIATLDLETMQAQVHLLD